MGQGKKRVEVGVLENYQSIWKAYQLIFCYCNKVPKIISLKNGEVYFGSQCWRFQSMVSWSTAFVPRARHIMAELVLQEVAHLMVGEKQKRMRKKRSWGPNSPFEDILPIT